MNDHTEIIGPSSFLEKTNHFLQNPSLTSLGGDSWTDFQDFFKLLGECKNTPIEPEDFTGQTFRGYVESPSYGHFFYCYREIPLEEDGHKFCIERIDDRVESR
jgi:hypothetical protein